MVYDYFESAEGTTLTARQACNLVLQHQVRVQDFVKDCGSKTEYDAQEVLRWLGY